MKKKKKIIMSLSCFILLLFVLYLLTFNSRFFCNCIYPFYSNKGSPHDTGGAYCETISVLREYEADQDFTLLRDWLLYSNHDGGIAMTVWGTSSSWFMKHPDKFESFVTSLDENSYEKFKERYLFTLRDTVQSEGFKSKHKSSDQIRIINIINSI